MRAKLEGKEGYKEAATELNRYPYCAVHAAMQALYFMSQKDGMTLEQYLDKFLNQQDVLEQFRGNIGP
eukprot:6663304-Ditylum_brightwellii.AAC.1